MVGDGDLVAGDTDVEAVQFRPSLSFGFPFLGRTEVRHDLEGRAPPLELNLPVHQDGSGHNHQVRTPYSLLHR